MKLTDHAVTSAALELFNKLGPAAQAAGMEVGTQDEMFTTLPDDTILDRVTLTIFNDPNNDYSRLENINPKDLFTQWFYTKYDYIRKRFNEQWEPETTPAILNTALAPKRWRYNKIYLVDSLKIDDTANDWGDHYFTVGYYITRDGEIPEELRRRGQT